MDNKETVCFCGNFTKGEVMQAIKDGANTYEALQETGISENGCCKATIMEILEGDSE